VLYERTIHEFMGETLQEVDLKALPPAMYFLQLRNGETMHNKPFVITR
jgi:hypothetical protein